MERYVMIFEDGIPYLASDFTDDDRAAVEDGILEVIRQSDLKTWYNGTWNDLAKWGDS